MSKRSSLASFSFVIFAIAMLPTLARGGDLLPKRGTKVHAINFTESSANTQSQGLSDYFGRFVLVSYFSSSRSAEWIVRLKEWDSRAWEAGATIMWVTDEPPEKAATLFKSYGKKGFWLCAKSRKDLVRVFGEGPMSDNGQSVLVGPFGRVLDWDRGRIMRLLNTSARRSKKSAEVWKWGEDCSELVRDIRKGEFGEIWHTYRRNSSKSNCGKTAWTILKGQESLLKSWLIIDPLAATRRATWFDKEFGLGEACSDVAKDTLKEANRTSGIRKVLKAQRLLLKAEEHIFPAGIDAGLRGKSDKKSARMMTEIAKLAESSEHAAVREDAQRLVEAVGNGD